MESIGTCLSCSSNPTFDRTDESRDIPLEFTTVVQPNYDMGRIACKILLDCIEEGDMGIHKVTLPVSFWEGGSVKGVK
jgi:DNA-binding LacI/PurR family transcriptional regulator